jgi:hypothetical protein
MNHHDALDFGMFWTGALMAFTPVVLAGIVVLFWWRWRKRERAAGDAAGRTPPT